MRVSMTRVQLSVLIGWSVVALAAIVSPTSSARAQTGITIDDFKNGLNPDGGVIVNRRPGATGRAGRDVKLSGTTTSGAPSEVSCEYATGDKFGSSGKSVLKSPLQNVSVNTGHWVGTVDVPLSKDWIVCRVRSASGAVSDSQKVKWGVGINWLWIGQSNFNRAYQLASGKMSSDSRTQAYTRSGWHPIDWMVPPWDSQSALNDNSRVFANSISRACDCLAGILPFATAATRIQEWINNPADHTNVWRTHANLDGDGIPVKFTSTADPATVTLAQPSFHVGQMIGLGVGRSANSRKLLVTSVSGSNVTLMVAVTGKPFDASTTPGGEMVSATGLSSPNLVDHDFEGAIWQQGENNAGAPQAAYFNLLTTLWHQILALTKRSPQQLAFGVVPMGNMLNAKPRPIPYFEGMRQAQMQFIDSNARAGAFFAGSMIDATHVGGDEVHAGAADYAHFFRRLTQSALHASGLANHGAAGPKISSANMAVGSSTVTITVAHDAGSQLQDSTGNTSGSGLKGFRVLKNGAPCVVTNAAIAGPAKIVLQTQCTRGGSDAMTMDYAYGDNPSDARAHTPVTVDDLKIIYDNAVPLSGTDYADTLGTPLQPTRGQLSIGR